ncbi:hypothetical protein V1L52_12825 [Treponema sp. HNW]|uniref:hypothetical protein n=1 Tax=Treponema sp. HNW TaxID=3116654 RepID=UPI003D137416
MCKNTYKKIYAFVSAALLGLLIISCSQEPIFWAIDQEIKLTDPSIKGNVYSVVRSGSFLYTANGNIYKKPVKTERGWEKISKPAGNAVYLAASNSHIYALSAGGETVQVYALNVTGGEWQPVPGTSGKADEIVLFDNKLTSASDSAAYVRVGGKVYKLNGPAPVSPLSEITTNGAGNKTLAAAYIDGSESGSTAGDYFSDTRTFCSDGARLYSADGKTIKKGTTNSDLTNTSVSTSETVTCLVYDEKENRLIAGTKKGLEEIKLNGSGVPQKAGLLGANAEAAFGESEIFSVACFGGEDNNAIYAGAGRTASSKNNALWGYYPSRGNWNYE